MSKPAAPRTVSAFCIGSLIKHVTLQQYAWTLSVASTDLRPDDPRSLLGMMADLANKDVLDDDESLVCLAREISSPEC